VVNPHTAKVIFIVYSLLTITLISKKIWQDLQKEKGKEKFSLLDLKLLYHGQFQAQNIIYTKIKVIFRIFLIDFLDFQ
jgi:hypothetical protein